jgi:hypothetical protein
MRWKCKECQYVKHFTRAIPLEATGRCPRCKSPSFEAVLMKSNQVLGMEIVFYKEQFPMICSIRYTTARCLAYLFRPIIEEPNKMRLNTLVNFSKSKWLLGCGVWHVPQI